MSTAGYRALIALTNLLLVGLIAMLGVRTFVGSELAAKLNPPEDFNPTLFEITNAAQQGSTIDQHQHVWKQLDPAPPPPAATPKPGPAVAQRPQDLASLYELMAVGKTSFIVQKRGGPQQTLGKGDVLDGFTIEDIEISGAGDNRVAIVTVKRGGGPPSTIRLIREPQR